MNNNYDRIYVTPKKLWLGVTIHTHAGCYK